MLQSRPDEVQLSRRSADKLGREHSQAVAKMLLKENKVQIEWMIGWGELGADGERWLSASLVELINGDQTVQVLQFAEPDYQHLILGDLEPFKLTVPIRNAKLSLVIDPDAPCIGWDVKLGRGGAAMTFRSKSDQAARFDI